MPARAYFFADRRFEVAEALLVSPQSCAHLRPKVAEVLLELLSHAGDTVSRQHLLDAVWHEPVADNALTVCINELRGRLAGQRSDGSPPDGFIATVHRYGYRFLPPVHRDLPPLSAPLGAPPPADRLAVLESWWTAARSGRRTSGVVIGPRGTGKSTLLQAFHHRLTHSGYAAVALVRCVRNAPGRPPDGHPGAFVEVFGALCRGPAAAAARSTLVRYAPSWLALLPSLIRREVYEQIAASARGASTERLLREAADALDALSARVPVAILLDDVDASNRMDAALVSLLAGRSGSARLLLVATSATPVCVTEVPVEHIDLPQSDGLAVLNDAVVRARALLAGNRPDVALRTWLRHVALQFRTRPEALAMLVSAAPRRRTEATAHRLVLAAVATLLDEGTRHGSLRADISPDDVATLLYGVLRATAHTSPETVARLVDLVVDGLHVAGGTGRGSRAHRAADVRFRSARIHS
ncbi:AAA family ATPase [Luteimicrobium album]|uniref:AAA family ATPase n=1 Tax=Luteimicrobium album TaxID=1054550 RepID=UPI0024E1061F|nr:AAA family ATPase [Luteimicrobium album]